MAVKFALLIIITIVFARIPVLMNLNQDFALKLLLCVRNFCWKIYFSAYETVNCKLFFMHWLCYCYVYCTFDCLTLMIPFVLVVDVLYNSPAGAMLSFIIHSLLMLPVYIIRPLLHELLSLLPLLDKLNRMLPAAALLEEQELEWSLQGNYKQCSSFTVCLRLNLMAENVILRLQIWCG